jgi:hypothetical protein
MCIIFTIIIDKAALSELQPPVNYSARFVIWLSLLWLSQLLRSKIITCCELFRISLKGTMNSYFVWERSVCCNMTPIIDFSNVLVGEGGKISLQSRLNRVRILLLILEKIFNVASFPCFFGNF